MEWLQRLALELRVMPQSFLSDVEEAFAISVVPLVHYPCVHPGTKPSEAETRMYGLVGFPLSPHRLSPSLEEKESMTLGGG